VRVVCREQMVNSAVSSTVSGLEHLSTTQTVRMVGTCAAPAGCPWESRVSPATGPPATTGPLSSALEILRVTAQCVRLQTDRKLVFDAARFN